MTILAEPETLERLRVGDRQGGWLGPQEWWTTGGAGLWARKPHSEVPPVVPLAVMTWEFAGTHVLDDPDPSAEAAVKILRQVVRPRRIPKGPHGPGTNGACRVIRSLLDREGSSVLRSRRLDQPGDFRSIVAGDPYESGTRRRNWIQEFPSICTPDLLHSWTFSLTGVASSPCGESHEKNLLIAPCGPVRDPAITPGQERG